MAFESPSISNATAAAVSPARLTRRAAGHWSPRGLPARARWSNGERFAKHQRRPDRVSSTRLCLLPLPRRSFRIGSVRGCLATGFACSERILPPSLPAVGRDLTATAYQERIDRDYDWDPNSGFPTHRENGRRPESARAAFVGSRVANRSICRTCVWPGLIVASRHRPLDCPVNRLHPRGIRRGRVERWETFRPERFAGVDRRRPQRLPI